MRLLQETGNAALHTLGHLLLQQVEQEALQRPILFLRQFECLFDQMRHGRQTQ